MLLSSLCTVTLYFGPSCKVFTAVAAVFDSLCHLVFLLCVIVSEENIDSIFKTEVIFYSLDVLINVLSHK